MTMRIFLDGEFFADWAGDLPSLAEFSGVEVSRLSVDPVESAIVERDRIAARRYQAEVGGITLNGLQINTDDRSKLLINGAALEAVIDPAYTMQWKTPAGFVELTGPQVIGIAQAVRAHVQACFDREAELLAALEAGTLTDEMLEQGWP